MDNNTTLILSKLESIENRLTALETKLDTISVSGSKKTVAPYKWDKFLPTYEKTVGENSLEAWKNYTGITTLEVGTVLYFLKFKGGIKAIDIKNYTDLADSKGYKCNYLKYNEKYNDSKCFIFYSNEDRTNFFNDAKAWGIAKHEELAKASTTTTKPVDYSKVLNA